MSEPALRRGAQTAVRTRPRRPLKHGGIPQTASLSRGVTPGDAAIHQLSRQQN
jgi:hypothetical protein